MLWCRDRIPLLKDEQLLVHFKTWRNWSLPGSFVFFGSNWKDSSFSLNCLESQNAWRKSSGSSFLLHVQPSHILQVLLFDLQIVHRFRIVLYLHFCLLHYQDNKIALIELSEIFLNFLVPDLGLYEVVNSMFVFLEFSNIHKSILYLSRFLLI